MNRILFYIERDLHLPFLLPVLNEIKKKSEIETGLSVAPFIPSSIQKAGQGVEAYKLQEINKIAPIVEDPGKFSPDITVIADACQELLPEYIGPTINIGHGLICKGTFYSPLPYSCRENFSSALCVPGPWHKKRLKKQVDIPITVTGFIKTDQIVNSSFTDRKTFNKQRNLPLFSKNILYAPTYNPDLSSLPWILNSLSELADLDVNLLIKLHNMTYSGWVHACQELARDRENIILLDDQDYAHMMFHADVMLSDVSSIFIEFMLMDKPVVLFRRPEIRNFSRFDPNDIEHQVLDATTIVKNPSELKTQVNHELEYPLKKSSQRKKYRQALDYKRDGKSAQRVANSVMETLDQVAINKRSSKKKFLLLVECLDIHQFEIEKTLQIIFQAGFEQEMQIFCLIKQEVKKNFAVNVNYGDSYVLFSQILESGADYVLLLKSGYHLPYNWAKHLALHIFWQKQKAIIRALAQKDIAQKVLKHFDYSQIDQMSELTLAHCLRTAAIESRVTGVAGPSPCILAPLKLAQRLITEFYPPTLQGLSTKIHQQADLENIPIYTALDVFMYPFSISKNAEELY